MGNITTLWPTYNVQSSSKLHKYLFNTLYVLWISNKISNILYLWRVQSIIRIVYGLLVTLMLLNGFNIVLFQFAVKAFVQEFVLHEQCISFTINANTHSSNYKLYIGCSTFLSFRIKSKCKVVYIEINSTQDCMV